MKQRTLIIVWAFCLFQANAQAQQKQLMEETVIRKQIESGYLNGALNDLNTAAMRNVYHTDFAIFFEENGELKKLPLSNWISLIENYKKSNDTSGLRKFTYEFVQIDVTGNAAFVKLKLMRNDVLIFTDLLTLLKFGDDWKIVTKIYCSHVQNPWSI
ncbi:MAG: nuclear transport factor 2 family protein [Filimonas sp.]|nr:nuclear transport factor 2 family protein [Filimonas sp.]